MRTNLRVEMVNSNRFYTYAYLREDKTPYYVGKGKGYRIYNKSKREFKPPKDKSRIIYLKQNLTEEEAFKHEIYMIAVFGRKDLGTGILHNRTNGGEGVSGAVISEEHKRKLSEVNKGNTNRLGKTHSKKTRIQMSEAKQGKTFSQEHRKKISEANKGKNCGKTPSEETKRKMSEATQGQTHSEETKRKIGEAKKNTKWWNDGCGNRKRMVECPGNGWKLGRK